MEGKCKITLVEFYEKYCMVMDRNGNINHPIPLRDDEKAFMNSVEAGTIVIYRKRDGYTYIDVNDIKKGNGRPCRKN